MSATVNYEVYASNGRMVYDVKKPCSEAVQLTLDGGDYTVEASIGSDKKEEKFTIGGGESKLLLDMTTITKKPTKQELIEADSQSETPVKEETKQKQPQAKISTKVEQDPKKALETLGKMFGGMAQQAGKENAEDIQKAGKFLEALGGMLGSKQTKEQKETAAKVEKKQAKDNAKANEEFDEMRKELDMFTK